MRLYLCLPWICGFGLWLMHLTHLSAPAEAILANATAGRWSVHEGEILGMLLITYASSVLWANLHRRWSHNPIQQWFDAFLAGISLSVIHGLAFLGVFASLFTLCPNLFERTYYSRTRMIIRTQLPATSP
jgi:hypothetical protein